MCGHSNILSWFKQYTKDSVITQNKPMKPINLKSFIQQEIIRYIIFFCDKPFNAFLNYLANGYKMVHFWEGENMCLILNCVQIEQ